MNRPVTQVDGMDRSQNRYINPEWRYIHRKKRFSSFPSLAGMSLTKLPLGRNNSVVTSLFPPKESLVFGSDIPAGNGKLANILDRPDMKIWYGQTRYSIMVWTDQICKSVTLWIDQLCKSGMEWTDQMYKAGMNRPEEQPWQ